MRKFLRKFLCLLIIVLCILGVTNYAYCTMDKSDGQNVKKFKTIGDNIEISNIGSSHGAYGFCYDNLKKKYNCFNFALSSQYFSYDYSLLCQYKKNLKNGGIMFIPVSYFSFYVEKEEGIKNFQAKNKRYHKILSPWRVKKYSLYDDITTHYLPILSAGNNTMQVVFSGRSRDNNEEVWNRKATQIDVKKDGLEAYKRHIVDNKGVINQQEINALYSIIQFCKEKNIKPILITTPYLKEYTTNIPQDFYEDFSQIISKVKSDTGVIYLDYSKDNRFVESYDLFMNSDHLNKTGALKFTDILQKEVIDKIGLEK